MATHKLSPWLFCLFASCASLVSSERSDALPKTQVLVLGMIHEGHRTSETWGLEQLRETIRRIDPDVVCCEIPPANWPRALELWQAEKKVEDSRVRVFPEYTDVLLPLTDELHFVVEPVAAWTAEMASARKERLDRFDTSGEDAGRRAAYERDEAWARAWLAANPAPAGEDDPAYIHSPRYDLRTKAGLGAYELHLGSVIPSPGGWTEINEAHFALIRDAITRHAGKRLLITFGAGHKYWYLERLREMPEVELVDVREFLPAATPPAERGQAIDEFLLGVDLFRAIWASERGASGVPRQSVAAMLDLADDGRLLTALDASAGSAVSEFLSGPFLGPVEVVAHQMGGPWRLQAQVRRLGDRLGDEQWLSATLRLDPKRPGGFAWTQVSLPNWLLLGRRP